jgi:hypothetical protein
LAGTSIARRPKAVVETVTLILATRSSNRISSDAPRRPAVSRTLFALTVAAACLPSSAGAPRVKDGPVGGVYCPTRLGDKWVYVVGDREQTFQVTEVEARGTETRVTVSDVTDGRPQPFETVAVRPTGVYRVKFVGVEVEEQCVFRLSGREGDTWKTHLPNQAHVGGGDWTTTVGRAEEVEVPAGRFRAVRVEVTVTARNGRPVDPPEVYVSWHAPEVGLVKTTLNGTTIRVLKSFTPASGK